jgi:hypothetical protein
VRSKTLRYAIRIFPVLVLAMGAGAPAQTPKHMTFTGTIGDFTPAANVAGPWDVRGTWTMTVNGNAGKATFSAALTMVRSDQGVMQNGGDLDNPTIRNAHTHHITLLAAAVTPVQTGGFQVAGTATITGNGAFPPPFGGTSALTITISGGNSVTYSNIAVIFQGDSANHFGAAPLHGVIISATGSE